MMLPWPFAAAFFPLAPEVASVGSIATFLAGGGASSSEKDSQPCSWIVTERS